MRSCNRVFIYFLSIFVAVATLSLGSYFQKSLINAPITVMGFLIPAIYGTLVGFLGGFFICRTINLIYKLKNKNKEIEQEKVRAIEHELKFKKLFESAHDAILILKKGKVVDCNFKACEIYKCKEDALEGENPLHFAPQYQPDGKNSVEESNRLLALAEHGMSQSFEWTQQRGDGAGFVADVSLNFLQLQDEIYVQAIIRDITDKKLNQQKILYATITAEEKERERYAKELHDGLGPIFSTVKLYFQWLANATDEKKRKVIIDKGNKSIAEAINTLREISFNLNPHILKNFGLKSAIESFVEKLSENRELQFNCDIELEERLPLDIEITMYRVFTELINNTMKYAEASNVDIHIIKLDNQIHAFYRDDGKGFTMNEENNYLGGIGLFNMKNRIQTIGGDIEITSKPNEGMAVKINLELKN